MPPPGAFCVRSGNGTNRVLKQRQQFFASFLALADAMTVAAACYAAWVLTIVARGRWWPASWENYFKEPLALYAVPISLAGLWAAGLYKPRRDRSLIGEVGGVARVTTACVGLLIVVLWATGDPLFVNPEFKGPAADPGLPGVLAGLGSIDAARLQLAALTVLTPLFVGGFRVVFRLQLRRLRKRGRNLRHVAVVGVGKLGQMTARTIERNSWTGIAVNYFISHHDETEKDAVLGRPVRGGLARLEEIVQEHHVDAVYLALPAARFGMVPDLLRRLEVFALDVRIVPDVHPRYLPSSMAVSELEGMPILSYRESPIYGIGGAAKRLVDVVGSLVALVVFAPLILSIFVALKLVAGPGRVLFKQRRVGINGEVFKIYKFRTMRTDVAPPDGTPHGDGAIDGWTKRDDPRIFPLGRFLRATSLDELPQLVNVLSGRMSLVGPRPERPELIERFRKDRRGYMLRQHVKSGMTGWAQVNGLRGDTCLRKRLQYDLFYVRKWSLWFDIRILWLTIFRGFVNTNAH